MQIVVPLIGSRHRHLVRRDDVNDGWSYRGVNHRRAGDAALRDYVVARYAARQIGEGYCRSRDTLTVDGGGVERCLPAGCPSNCVEASLVMRDTIRKSVQGIVFGRYQNNVLSTAAGRWDEMCIRDRNKSVRKRSDQPIREVGFTI